MRLGRAVISGYGRGNGQASVTRPLLIHDWHDVPDCARAASIALGNFDGVHLGHLDVLRAAHTARPDRPRAVLSFSPHPREFFRPDDPPFRLTVDSERAAQLAVNGVEILFELTFDRAFSELSATDFINEVLHKGVGATHLACGADFAFGHRRGGDVSLLAACTEPLGIGLTVVPHRADSEGPISSTRIRRLLQDGYLERAALLLGRAPAIRGTVIHGDARGRAIGYPTANITLGRHLEPARGVYVVTAELRDGVRIPGVANIGRRPTVTAGTESCLEVHLLDYAGDLYDLELTVELHHFLREERRFGNILALREQIGKDTATAREWFAARM